MKIRDLICFGGPILTAILIIITRLCDNCPIFIPTIPLCIMVICFIIDISDINNGEDNWFDKKL